MNVWECGQDCFLVGGGGGGMRVVGDGSFLSWILVCVREENR